MSAGWSQKPGRAMRRRGFGLVEMTVAGVLFMAIVLITLQLIAWTARDRQAITRRAAASRLVGTVMERVLARPFAALSTEALAPLVADASAGRSPGAGVLRVEVEPAGAIDGHDQKKVVVEVQWPAGVPGATAPVRLVAWTTDRRGTRP